MTLEECRRFYSEEIHFAANISSTTLIEAFARVPRENFLGSGPWKIASVDFGLGGATYTQTPDADPRHLYHNVPVALDPARYLNNGQPAALAKWIDALGIKTGMRVYHLGCGVGYFTAIMAEMVGPKGSVVASEIDPELATRASQNLRAYPNVSVHSGDGIDFDAGRCDAILINAGVTHPHPRWLENLNEDGSLVVPLTVPFEMGMGANLGGNGVMARIAREPNGFSARVVSLVAIYSCVGLRDAQLEQALGKAMGTGKLFKLRSLRRDVHELADTCLVHGARMCLSSSETSTSAAV
jgi:protein-L-isoaspartate(D-aspartate) O-methyltransferase